MDENSSLAQNHDTMRQRAELNSLVRRFFLQRNVLEVETPVFSAAGNPDPSIHSLLANFAITEEQAPDIRYAHTSPEFAMKRLLTRNIGSIYQICKVFRVGELGRLHNPEFTMLEWYRTGFDYHQLMDEINDMLYELDFSEQCEKISYVEMFSKHLGIDIPNVNVADLKNCAGKNGLDVVGLGDTMDVWLDLLLSHLIEPKLGHNKPVFVYDYPSSQAALAVVREEKYPVAERFELYINGVEIGNGYQELTCANEYVERFNVDNQRRLQQGLAEVKLDENFLSAMQKGLPKCAGVAIGLDRLLMAKLNISNITDVLSFDFSLA